MTFDIQEILGLLPHRYPFLLIDRVVEFERGKRLVAIKNVTMNEPFFRATFPGYPIMPGVLVIEAMAQAGAIIMMSEIPTARRSWRSSPASRRPSSAAR
jgi:3-hydroxyacyl-[acyl-carrier-protein] dehydratase